MMSRGARKPTLPPRSRRSLFVLSFTFTLTALLCAIVAPPVHAQNPTPGWDGTVEVNTSLLEIEKGKSTSYSLRLSQAPTADGWFVRVHVDGAVRTDGVYKGLSWAPSVGWDFDKGENPWRTINISVADDAVVGTEVTFTHDVWDHTTNCPVHGVGRVTVRIVEDRPPEPLPQLSIRDAARVTEGSAASFEVRLSKSSQERVTVAYATQSGTADEGTDFDREAGRLTFDPNTTSQTIEVQTKGRRARRAGRELHGEAEQPERSDSGGRHRDRNHPRQRRRTEAVDRRRDGRRGGQGRVRRDVDRDEPAGRDGACPDERRYGAGRLGLPSAGRHADVPDRRRHATSRRGADDRRPGLRGERDVHGQLEQCHRGRDRRPHRGRNDHRQRPRADVVHRRRNRGRGEAGAV